MFPKISLLISGWMKNIIKGLALFSSSLTILALYVIKNTSPAMGYEFSIYEAFPHVLWFLILASNACGLLILIIEAFADIKNSKLWIFGLYILFFNNFIVLLLPYFRGYTFYGLDGLSHLGHIKYIMTHSYFDGGNFYPIAHIFYVAISLLTGFDLMRTEYVVIPIFPILYFVSIILLANQISENKTQNLLIIAFGFIIPVMVHTTWYPASMAFSFFPLVIYLFFRWMTKLQISSSQFDMLLILILIVMPFFHPLVAIYLITTLIYLQVSLLIYKKIGGNKTESFIFNTKKLDSKKSFYLFFVAGISWFTWFSTFSIFGKGIKNVLNFLFDISQSQIAHYANLAERANMSIYELIELLMKMHGQYIIYIILGIIICIILLKDFLSYRKINYLQLAFSLVFIFFVILTIVIGLSHFMIRNYARILKYILFSTTILNGLGIATYLNKKQPRTRIVFCCIVLLLLISSQAFAMFNLFPSPIVKKPNYQITAMDLEGMNWFLSFRDKKLLIDEIYVYQYRLSNALRGIDYPKVNIRYPGIHNLLPPDHFGYFNHTMLGQVYSENRYLLINKRSEEYYVQLVSGHPTLMRFFPEDFNRLMIDRSVNQLYSNGEFKVFIIQAYEGNKYPVGGV